MRSFRIRRDVPFQHTPGARAPFTPRPARQGIVAGASLGVREKPPEVVGDVRRAHDRGPGIVGGRDAGQAPTGNPTPTRRPRDVGVEAIADEQWSPAAGATEGRSKQRGRRLADHLSADAGRRLDRGQQSARARPRRAVRRPGTRHRRSSRPVSRPVVRGPTRSAASCSRPVDPIPRRPHRPFRSRRRRPSCPRRRAPLRSPSSPITKTRSTPRPASTVAVVSADVSTSSAAASTPTERSRSATRSGVRPELFVTNAMPLPSDRSRRQRPGGMRNRIVAAIQHPVEVEQEGFVAVGDHRRKPAVGVCPSVGWVWLLYKVRASPLPVRRTRVRCCGDRSTGPRHGSAIRRYQRRPAARVPGRQPVQRGAPRSRGGLRGPGWPRQPIREGRGARSWTGSIAAPCAERRNPASTPTR